MNELMFSLGIDIGTAKKAVETIQELIDDIAQQAQSALNLNATVKTDGVTEAATKIRSSLGSAGKAAGDGIADGIAAGAEKGAKEGAKKAGTAFDSLFQNLFKFNTITDGIKNIGSAFGDITSPFKALDTATAQLKSLGAEAAALAPSLREAAITMSKDLPFAAAEIQTTMFDALASGVKGGEEGLKAFADTAAKLAVGGGSDIGAATNLLAGNLNAYGKSAEDAAKFSDIFFNTINLGVTSAGELSSTLANVIPTASGLGIELENVGGALAFMTSRGIPTAQSTTKLNALFLELAKPGAELAKVLKTAGVSLESLKQDDVPTTLAKVKSALDATGKAAVQVFSSSEAGAAFGTLTGDLDAFAQTVADVRDTAGSTDFAYQQMAGSIENQTKQMLSTVNAFVIEGLDVLGSGFVGVIDTISGLAPTISSITGITQLLPKDLFADVTKSAKTLFTVVDDNGVRSFAGLGASLKNIGGSVKDAASSLLKFLLPSLFTTTTATTATGAAANATGVSFSLAWAAATLGIAALIAAIVYLLTQTEKGREIAADIGEAFGEMSNVLKAMFAGVISQIGSVVDAIGSLITGDIGGFFDALTGMSDKATTAMVDSLTDSTLADAIDDLKSNLEGTIEIQARINTADSIPKLTDQLQKLQGDIGELEVKVNTGTATEKDIAALDALKKKSAEVSDQIRQIAPSAEEGARTITTSTGEVLTVYDIAIDKAKEFGQAQKDAANADLSKNQKEFTADLQESINAYAAQKQRLEELTAQRNDALKNGDTETANDLKEKIKEFTDKVSTSRDEINKAITDGSKAGLIIPTDLTIPPSAANEFQTKLDAVAEEAKRKLREKQLGDVVSPIIEIDAKIKQNDALPKLVEQYKNAASDVEKQNIAKVIQQSAPDAVKAVGQVLNAEGKLVDVLEVNADAALESAAANKARFSSNLQSQQAKAIQAIQTEGKAFQDARKKADEYKTAIERAPAGTNTDGLQRQRLAAEREAQSAAVQVAKLGAASIKAGGSAEEAYKRVAASLGRSTEEAKTLVDNQVRISNEAENSAQQVRNLAAEYNNAKNAAAALQSEGAAAAATLQGDLNELNQASAEGRAKAAQEVIAGVTQAEFAAAEKSVQATGKVYKTAAEKNLAIAKKLTVDRIADEEKKQKDGHEQQIKLRQNFDRRSLEYKNAQAQKDIENDLKARQSFLKQEQTNEERALRQRSAVTVEEQTALEIELLNVKQKYAELDLQAQIAAATRRKNELTGTQGLISNSQEVRAASQAIEDLQTQLNNSIADFPAAVAKAEAEGVKKLTEARRKQYADQLKEAVDAKKIEIDEITDKTSEGLKKRAQLEAEYADLQFQLSLYQTELTLDAQAAAFRKHQKDKAKIAADAAREIARAEERERIAAITDNAEREKELRIQTAKELLEDELESAGKDSRARQVAFLKFHTERLRAEKEFAAASATSLQYFQTKLPDIAKAFADNFKIDFAVDEEGAQQARAEIAAISDEQAKLTDEQRKGSKTFQEVQEEMNGLYAKQEEAQKKLRESTGNLFGSIAKAVSSALASVTETFVAEAQKQTQAAITENDKIQELYILRADLQQKLIDTQIEAEQALTDAQKDENEKRQKDLEDALKAAEDSIESSIEARERALLRAQTAIIGIAAGGLAQLITSGDDAGKIVVGIAFKVLKALAGVWAAQIVAGSLAQPDSIATFGATAAARIAILTALLEGALVVAEAAVNSASGFRKGGYTGDGDPDAPAGIVHKKEFVHTAEETAKHRPLFEHIRKGGDPAQFILQRYAGDKLKDIKLTVTPTGKLDWSFKHNDDPLRNVNLREVAARSQEIARRAGDHIERGQRIVQEQQGMNTAALERKIDALAHQLTARLDYQTRQQQEAHREEGTRWKKYDHGAPEIKTTIGGGKLESAITYNKRKRRK